ncbi:MAG: hypothetical protein QOD60_512 [Solirubrobacterales bacterium]|jgi:uncharacterized protein YkwD|nr:hypothetical protein [Solirubrobacterales bacterium]
MNGKRLIAALLSAALLAVPFVIPETAPAQMGATCAGVDALPQSTTTAALGESIRCLLNQHRASAGLGPLGRQGKLLHAANAHAKDMVNHQFVSHIGSNGSTPLSRVRRTGFLKGASFFAVGEDMAWGNSYEVTPASVVRAWMNSPVHRRNILDKRFNRIGAGIVRGEPTTGGDSNVNTLTFVAVFAVVRH